MALINSVHRIGKGLGVLSAIAFGLRSGLRSKPIVLVDVGGRGGLSRSWHFLWRSGIVTPVFFEPDTMAASQIVARYESSAFVIQKAAWSADGTKIFHVTEEPGASSTLYPLPDPRMPECVKRMLRVEKKLSVEAVRADTALNNLGVIPEVVKIDVQGGELEVLRGFGPLLNSIFCCELEVSFMRGYVKQPLCNDVFDFMMDSGFGLFDIKVFGVARTRSSVQANSFFCRKNINSSRQNLVEIIFCLANDFVYRP